MAFLDTPYHITGEAADLYVEQVGPEEAPCIYYLHGGPGYNSYSFRDLVGEDLEGYRMVYADQRGGGRSYADRPFTLDDLADDVATVLDALEVPSANLLAHGFGALVATRAALRHPSRVERLVFVNPWFSMPMLARSLQREAAVASGAAEQALPPEEALADPEALDPEGVVDQAFESYPAKLLFDRMEFPSASSRLRLEHSDSEALFGPHAAAMPETPWRLDVLSELEKVKHPAAVLAARGDRSCYPEQVESGLERLPHALFSLLPGGHYPWIDAPALFLETLEAAVRAGG